MTGIQGLDTTRSPRWNDTQKKSMLTHNSAISGGKKKTR
jgi:hypothetical protein